MKKFISVLLIALSVVSMFGLVGCFDDNGKKSESSDKKSEDIVLSKVLADINKEFSISEDSMTSIETAEDLEMYYGIDPADVKQFAAQVTVNTATDIAEIILVEAVDEKAAQRVFDALDKHYNGQKDNCASYSPENFAIVEKCSVDINGNYVSLIMDANAKKMVEFYTASIK